MAQRGLALPALSGLAPLGTALQHPGELLHGHAALLRQRPRLRRPAAERVLRGKPALLVLSRGRLRPDVLHGVDQSSAGGGKNDFLNKSERGE